MFLDGNTVGAAELNAIAEQASNAEQKAQSVVDRANAGEFGGIEMRFLNDNTSTNVDYILENNTDKSFSAANIISIKLTIPQGIIHGFGSGVNFKSGAQSPSFSIINNSRFTHAIMVFGNVVTNYSPPPNKKISTFSYCDDNDITTIIIER